MLKLEAMKSWELKVIQEPDLLVFHMKFWFLGIKLEKVFTHLKSIQMLSMVFLEVTSNQYCHQGYVYNSLLGFPAKLKVLKEILFQNDPERVSVFSFETKKEQIYCGGTQTLYLNQNKIARILESWNPWLGAISLPGGAVPKRLTLETFQADCPTSGKLN